MRYKGTIWNHCFSKLQLVLNRLLLINIGEPNHKEVQYLLSTVLVLSCNACSLVFLILLFNNKDSSFYWLQYKSITSRILHDWKSVCVKILTSFISNWLGSNNELMIGSVSLFSIFVNPLSQTQVQSRGNQSSHTKQTNQ